VLVSILAFVIIRLSRTMRSLKNLLELVGELRERGVGLAVLMQHIDATTPTGRLAFPHPRAIDKFQRELIIEGTREGVQAAVPAATPGPQALAERPEGRHRAPHVRSRVPAAGQVNFPWWLVAG
jgi:DNA invertase Pin-like site-specific DNA recombinase